MAKKRLLVGDLGGGVTPPGVLFGEEELGGGGEDPGRYLRSLKESV